MSDNVIGPYVDKGLTWPGNEGGKGHNVTALELPDGRYAIVVSETRPGDVFVSRSLDGPWGYLGKIQVAESEFGKPRMSNLSVMVRPDGNIQIVPRNGAIMISKSGILGPYTVQGPSVYPTVAEIKPYLRNLEDAVVWHSGGLYHIVVNDWYRRYAYHITSVDGINNWTYRGIAYDPRKDFIRYTDGTVNHWHKLERPGVLIENGHVTAVTLSVLDVEKKQEQGNDMHSSKIIVIPFDGAALDRDLQSTSAANATVNATNNPDLGGAGSRGPGGRQRTIVLGPDDKPAFPDPPAGFEQERPGIPHGRYEGERCAAHLACGRPRPRHAGVAQQPLPLLATHLPLTTMKLPTLAIVRRFRAGQK